MSTMQTTMTPVLAVPLSPPVGQSAGGDYLLRIRGILEMCKAGESLDTLPFGVGDVTAHENELLTITHGPREQVDLARAVEESNFFKNLTRRAASGDAPRRLVRDIEDYLSGNRDNAWENSWVYFPADLLTPYARDIFEGDLFASKQERRARRSDAARFMVERNGVNCIRIPVSYLLKLSLADAISVAKKPHPVIRRTGEQLMRHFLNDNTSPETLSFHTVGPKSGEGLGRELASETLRRLLLVQFLTMYANEKFELRSRGQETQVCLAPQTPLRQKRLNELVPDSFYRTLFMSPCLSGWDRGEAKHQYMILCHEVLSRSRLNTMEKLRESGILARDLVVLPTVSNTSLANNGTHISLGSRRLTTLIAAGAPGFTAEDEKRVGDLVVKIVEHFLPLFVGTYSAAPHRFDFKDFHPETVLGFLPHELDFTHLRMLWRRWKGKADLKCFGIPLTPFGPRTLDRFLGAVLGLRGDWVPDQRLIDYLVSPLSTDHSPALDGTIGNDDRLKRDLAEMGVFDPKMSSIRSTANAFSHAWGSVVSRAVITASLQSIERDMAAATDLQRLVTALAHQYVLSGEVTHEDIPDTPEVESKRRQVAGAGASLAMTCDMAFAAPGASFIQAFSKIGLVPDAGGSWFLAQRLGLARAMGLALTGDKLSATQARDWGMIWDVADDPLAAAIAMAQRLAVMPTQALVATRALLRGANTTTLEQQLVIERDTQSAMGATHDYIEGVSAFLAKRPPVFTGQ